MTKTIISLVTLGALTAAAPAYAAPASAANSRVLTQEIAVQYRDLNLATIEGQHVLDRRIDTAARKICQPGKHTTGTRIPSSKARQCYKRAKHTASQHHSMWQGSWMRNGLAGKRKPAQSPRIPLNLCGRAARTDPIPRSGLLLDQDYISQGTLYQLKDRAASARDRSAREPTPAIRCTPSAVPPILTARP